MISVPSGNARVQLTLLFLLGAAGCAAENSQPEGQVAVARAALMSAADCPFGYNIIEGTALVDTLTGTDDSDCILGHGGNDIIHGMGGDDVLIGGAGVDTLNGNDGDDILHGEDQADTMNGHAGNDTLHGGSSADIIYGGDGNDTIYGGLHDDDIYGGEGNDTVHGEAGADWVDGEGGDDRIYGGADNDSLRGGDGHDYLSGEQGLDNLYGDAGDDILDGGSEFDQLFGRSGNDILYGGVGSVDTLRGEDGNDAIIDDGENNDAVNGGNDTDRCSGTACELPAPTITGCTQDSECTVPERCTVEIGVCLPCLVDTDGDNVCDGDDGCPADPNKGAPGVCGCGVADTDADADGTADCDDACEDDPVKTEPGICGCGVADTDSDADGTADCNDACEDDPDKTEPGVCGCSVADVDSDADGTLDCNDGCVNDPDKVAAGICGCGVADTDSDADGTADCNDDCVNDPNKIASGICGCGVADTDTDADGTADCVDGCANDPDKIAAGACGCGVADTDSDADGTADCNDGCASDPNKTTTGVCGCGVADTDTDSDGTADCNDGCVNDPDKVAAGVCGCGVSDADSDADGVPDCNDICAGFDDNVDSDMDGIPDGCEGTCVPGATGPYVHEGDANVSTAADLAALQNIECITGSLNITETSITHLNDLASLQAVAGNLVIVHTDLTDVDLPSLTTVGGMVTIGKNSMLSTLAGLSNLTSIGSIGPETYLHIGDNMNLAPCWTWLIVEQTGVPCGRYLGIPFWENRCNNNDGTGSCGTLPPGFVCEPGATGPGVLDADVLLNTYEAHDVIDEALGAVCITGDVIVENEYIPNFDELASTLQWIGGDLIVVNSPSLTDIGLPTLTSIGGRLLISDNPGLESLAGLASLTDVGVFDPDQGFAIMNNANLSHCWVAQLEQQLGDECGTAYGQPNYYWCDGNDGTDNCPQPKYLKCGPKSRGIGVYEGSLTAYGSKAALALAAVDGFWCITGSLTVMSSGLKSLAQLSSLTAVAGDLQIIDNDKLMDVDPLAALQQVGGALVFQGNDGLGTLSGLSGLDFLALDSNAWAALVIQQNPALAQCWVDILEMQTNEVCGYHSGGRWERCNGNYDLGRCQ